MLNSFHMPVSNYTPTSNVGSSGSSISLLTLDIFPLVHLSYFGKYSNRALCFRIYIPSWLRKLSIFSYISIAIWIPSIVKYPSSWHIFLCVCGFHFSYCLGNFFIYSEYKCFVRYINIYFKYLFSLWFLFFLFSL